jgi:16S rRNA (cytidine1402-2'-O)-methyltransferase
MVRNSKSKNKDIEKGLYLVSTPIGNLDDITFRAINILKKSDYILCEDTRTSKILLEKYGIKSQLVSNHKFNEKRNLEKIKDLLISGRSIALISDAGTPSISDPGKILVNECIKLGIDIIPIPGPSAVSTAVSVSGFSEKFFFYGFLPEKLKILENDFNNLSKLDSSLVFFISAKKINKVIPFFKKYFEGRKIVICREMTKLYEEYIRFNINDLSLLESDLKGELTVVISEKKDVNNLSQKLDESDKKNIKKMINKLSIREITDLICSNKIISKKEVYNYCLKLKNEN